MRVAKSRLGSADVSGRVRRNNDKPTFRNSLQTAKKKRLTDLRKANAGYFFASQHFPSRAPRRRGADLTISFDRNMTMPLACHLVAEELRELRAALVDKDEAHSRTKAKLARTEAKLVALQVSIPRSKPTG